MLNNKINKRQYVCLWRSCCLQYVMCMLWIPCFGMYVFEVIRQDSFSFLLLVFAIHTEGISSINGTK